MSFIYIYINFYSIFDFFNMERSPYGTENDFKQIDLIIRIKCFAKQI